MKAFEQLERLKKMNVLIQNKCTGTPEEFAKKLCICQSHLYNLIDELKIIGAPIKYSRARQTYYYTSEFEIILQYSLCIIKRDQLKQIFGGKLIKTVYSNFFRVKENNLVPGIIPN